jgi:ABC-type sugar transport system substrate-binding protein
VRRRTAAVALLAGLAAGACNRGKEDVTIALVTKAMDSEFWLMVAEGAKAGAAERPGVKLTIVAPDREINVDQQVSMLEDQVRRGVKALVVSPAGSAQVMSALELAASRGIPVVLVDTDAPFPKKVSYIGTDNRRGGQLAAKCLVDRLGGKGEVALISGVPGNESQDARAQGFIDAVAQVPGMKLVAQQPANSERSLGLTVMENILTAHPDVNAVLSENDNMATGVTAALGGNADGKVKIGGQDGDTFALNRVALGTQVVSVWKNSIELGQAAGKAALELCKNPDITKVTGAKASKTAGGLDSYSLLLNPVPITKDNLQVVLDANWITKDVLCKGVTAGSVAGC